MTLKNHLGDHLNSGFYLTTLTTGTVYVLGLAAEAGPIWHLAGLIVMGVFALLGQLLKEWRDQRRENRKSAQLLKENTNLAQELVRLRQKYGD